MRAAALVALVAPTGASAQEWHELYSDGQRELRSGRPQQAVQLLQRAIAKRPQPGVSVPTYGTNFEPRYFPYLRLAEAYVQLSAWDEALEALATSARMGVEPAQERAALERTVRAALDARRPAPVPSQAPPPPPDTNPRQQIVPPKVLPTVVPAAPDTAVSQAAQAPSVAPDTPSRTNATGRTPQPTLDLTSTPAGAQVFVDDEPLGRTDPQTGRLRLTTVRPGRHRLRLAAEGHNDLVTTVTVGNEPTVFHAALSPRPTLDSAVAAPDTVRRRREPSAQWWLYGLVALAALFGARRIRRRPGAPIDAAPAADHPGPSTPVAPHRATTEQNSFDNFPVSFGEYQLYRRIGKGGMASVYEAERGGERFALKRPLGGFLDDARFLERFSHEAELGRALHHPNIVRIFARGQVGSVPYFAMELIDGETLRDRLDREGRLDPALATSVTARVAEALDYAHHKGVIHRDLKPSNIMLERSGGVKVMDYGIARARFQEGVTTTGSFLGTPHYAAPEAFHGRTEPRSDIYSLGVVFFEMLTGAIPFPSDNPFAVLNSHQNTPPPVPSTLNYALSPELDGIVLRLLSKDPSDRPTAEELLNLLADIEEQPQ